jgi:hypothetical protein
MLRRAAAIFLALFFMAGVALGADKEVKGKIVKVDLKKNTINVQTEDGQKVYMVNDDTKFIGHKGGVSEAGIKDARLVKGAEVKLVIAGNNRTAREVHLPERSKVARDFWRAGLHRPTRTFRAEACCNPFLPATLILAKGDSIVRLILRLTACLVAFIVVASAGAQSDSRKDKHKEPTAAQRKIAKSIAMGHS